MDTINFYINKLKAIKKGLKTLRETRDYYGDSEGYADDFDDEMLKDDGLDDIIAYLKKELVNKDTKGKINFNNKSIVANMLTYYCVNVCKVSDCNRELEQTLICFQNGLKPIVETDDGNVKWWLEFD
jgi:hypothetical protein